MEMLTQTYSLLSVYFHKTFFLSSLSTVYLLRCSSISINYGDKGHQQGSHVDV